MGYRCRMRTMVVATLVGVLLGACKKDSKPKPEKQHATLTTGTVGADGVRTIPVEARADGYSPDRIPGKPGEKLKLVFTRTVDGECFAELKTPDGKLVPLPKGSPVEVAVTVPKDGEVKFACGMDMYRGVIVAEKS
jgi:plastocyanin domain-containing protein